MGTGSLVTADARCSWVFRAPMSRWTPEARLGYSLTEGCWILATSPLTWWLAVARWLIMSPRSFAGWLDGGSSPQGELHVTDSVYVR